jgi:hypothetical protein
MINYKLTNVCEGLADVLETTTGFILGRALPVESARARVRHLNFGGGFDGATPSFFVSRDSLSYK